MMTYDVFLLYDNACEHDDCRHENLFIDLTHHDCIYKFNFQKNLKTVANVNLNLYRTLKICSIRYLSSSLMKPTTHSPIFLLRRFNFYYIFAIRYRTWTFEQTNKRRTSSLHNEWIPPHLIFAMVHFFLTPIYVNVEPQRDIC